MQFASASVASTVRHTGGRPRITATAEAVERLAADGLTDRQIAARFGCARETIWRLRRESHIATTRPAMCHNPLWPLPDDVEAAWKALLGVRLYEDVAPGRKWSLTGAVQTQQP